MDTPLETNRVEHPTLRVGVVMRRERVPGPMSRWQTWRWVLADVALAEQLPALPASGELTGPTSPVPIEPAGPVPEGTTHWLYHGFDLALYRGDVEGYVLNLSSPQPCIWVLWRLDNDLDDEAMPQPLIATVSYHDAGRWLDAQERVDQVPAPPAVVQWMARFVEAYHRPEPQRRKRRPDVQTLTDRFGNPVRISTEKIRGGGPVDG
jgi:hypothetical protein